jgi:hypothetical protein
MALHLAILAVVLIYALHLKVIAVEKVLELLVLLSIEDFLDFFNSLFKKFIVIAYDNYVEGLIILENVLLCFICPSTSHCYLAS